MLSDKLRFASQHYKHQKKVLINCKPLVWTAKGSKTVLINVQRVGRDSPPYQIRLGCFSLSICMCVLFLFYRHIQWIKKNQEKHDTMHTRIYQIKWNVTKLRIRYIMPSNACFSGYNRRNTYRLHIIFRSSACAQVHESWRAKPYKNEVRQW